MIKFDNVSKAYDKGTRAIKDLNLTIEKGEFVFLVGNSGSGKSTFIKLLLKEIEPTSGGITVDDQPLHKIKRRALPKYRRKLGVVFQDFRLLSDRNVYENVALAQRVVGKTRREIKSNVPSILTMVGLSAKYKNNPGELSGGEQQRVAIARALINEPEMLLADEPTGNLDPENSKGIMKLLEKINEMGTTVIVVTHNMELVRDMNKRVITMKRGVIISDTKEGGQQDEI
ncbi:MAG: cell division ATP-binding protein FtsE [Lachnospiraceae bacterium]